MTVLKSQVEPEHGYRHRVHRSKKNRHPKSKWKEGARDTRESSIARHRYLEELSFKEQRKWDKNLI